MFLATFVVLSWQVTYKKSKATYLSSTITIRQVVTECLAFSPLSIEASILHKNTLGEVWTSVHMAKMHAPCLTQSKGKQNYVGQGNIKNVFLIGEGESF